VAEFWNRTGSGAGQAVFDKSRIAGSVRASTREQTWDKTGTKKMTWGDKIPCQTGCAARDLNPNPRIKSPLLNSIILL
jgi:hypothetical protein